MRTAAARSARLSFCLAAAGAAFLGAPDPAVAGATTLKLDNGLEIVVIEDRRAPIVTHFIGYRAGGVDDPPGQAGVAHFAEHMMFKSAARLSNGPFSARLARFGGGSNAVTTHDATLYHARVPKEHLRLVMELEADRMVSLAITDADVDTEREVILAERRSRIDGRPIGALIERIDAALFEGDSYGRPSIGIASEIARISRTDTQAFYRRHYNPPSAFLVVAGDVSAAEVRELAAATYGKVASAAHPVGTADGTAAATAAVTARPSPAAPHQERRVVVRDPRASSVTLYRAYRVPSYRTAAPREAEAFELLAAILTVGRSSRLALRLLEADPPASAVDGGYLGVRRHGGQISFFAVATREGHLPAIEARLDAAIAEVAEHGVTADELEAARQAFVARRLYRSDDQFLLAQTYAEGLGAGLTVDRIERDAERLLSVSADDIRAAVRRHLVPANMVTGILAPPVPQSAESDKPSLTTGPRP